MATLLLEFWTEGNDFFIYAEMDDYEKELVLEGKAKSIITNLEAIYEILEETQEHRETKLENSIETLSQQLIAPFAQALTRCQLVRFVVSKELIRYPFDLLLFEEKPLFLQRSICYQIEEGEGEGEDNPEIEIKSALLIADLTADPEEACKTVSKLIPESKYKKMEDSNLSLIKDAADKIDVLVVSAHGDLDENNSGGISINDETISSKLIAKLEAWIVYFDSCQQGSNLDFLQTFQEKSDTQFYLAPIISNDAGDSSTKTMIWFFKAVLQHGNPIQALFETRKRLFDFYAFEEELSTIASFNKAFAFRIYEFVEL